MNVMAKNSVTSLDGVGPAVATKLERLGIRTVNDLIWHVPRTWIDLTNPSQISQLRRDELGVIEAVITNPRVERTKRRRFSVFRAELVDPAGNSLSAVWFNQPFLARQLIEGSQWIFWGTVGFDFQQRMLSFANPKFTKTPSILAIYPETEGVTSTQLRRFLQAAQPAMPLTEYVPEDLRTDPIIFERTNALRTLHEPQVTADIGRARNRLALDELVRLVALLHRQRDARAAIQAPVVHMLPARLQSLIHNLPFQLTEGQLQAVTEIVHDLSTPRPMARLVVGDVGSGKTVVALLAAAAVLESGYQVAWLAPTQILAEQHAATAAKMLSSVNILPKLVTGQTPAKDRVGTFLIGTHALLTDSVALPKLGLVIIDEQHRFGVAQRQKLLDRGSGNLQPHLLTMTATPIPRSLALTVFSDMDCSFMGMLPSGRKPIATRIVQATDRDRALEVLLSELRSGRQGFVICPAIAPTEMLCQLDILEDRRAVTERYAALMADPRFTGIRIGLLHGKLSAEEKRATMDAFSANQIQLLVATSLVEVGIDVPNATVMVIEGADQFGLAQLHQLRGRIGRGSKQSLCMAIAADPSEVAQARLAAFAGTNDGFALAELDLAQRGPGDLLGAAQAGLPPLKLARLTDTVVVQAARRLANALAERSANDPTLAKQFEAFLGEYEGNSTIA